MLKLTQNLKEKIKSTALKILKFFLNPRLLLCVFLAWMITNGWSYVFTAVGALCNISWMTIVGGAYLGLLWLPFTPEKIVTAILSIWFLKLFFPNDKATLGVIKEEYEKIKSVVKSKKKASKVNTNLKAKTDME